MTWSLNGSRNPQDPMSACLFKIRDPHDPAAIFLPASNIIVIEPNIRDPQDRASISMAGPNISRITSKRKKMDQGCEIPYIGSCGSRISDLFGILTHVWKIYSQAIKNTPETVRLFPVQPAVAPGPCTWQRRSAVGDYLERWLTAGVEHMPRSELVDLWLGFYRVSVENMKLASLSALDVR